MAITVSGRKMNVTPAIKDYVDEKIGRSLEVFDSAAMDAEVVLRTEKNPAISLNAICEVTVNAKGAVIRVAESAEDMYAAIDLASDKVARQLRKYKTRIVERRGGRGSIRHLQPDELDIPDVIPTEPEEDDDLLVRLKEVEMEPMTEEHALVQTDLLGHDFFVYFDQDAHQIQVIYHRKNGGYGIIRPIINA
ncbi:MAG TPA: ribosome-associated translation inhibitor RaiA [Coriobacteriaceae bacterium]|nr:ribosome-associated translation inhibitor RaiA [Coriobacteriaceae bacterium]